MSLSSVLNLLFDRVKNKKLKLKVCGHGFGFLLRKNSIGENENS